MLTYFFVFGVVLGARFPGAEPLRVRVVLPGRDAPVAGVQRGGGAVADGDARPPQFREEAGVRGGDAAGESGGGRAGDGVFAIVLFCGLLLITGRSFPATILWLPLLLIPQMLFTAGVSWFLAGLGVFVRDLGQILGFC